MAIRIRTVEMPDVGRIRVALCAAETDPMPGDVYLDDSDHYALVAKFCRDHETGTIYPEQWAAMDTQKLRDAKEELEKWLASLPESSLEETTSPAADLPVVGSSCCDKPASVEEPTTAR